jgi:hypothetical protein
MSNRDEVRLGGPGAAFIVFGQRKQGRGGLSIACREGQAAAASGLLEALLTMDRVGSGKGGGRCGNHG